MPNHKSAIKRVRQNERRNLRNSAARSTARTAVKRVRAAVEKGDKETAAKAFKAAVKVLDSSSSKGLYHKNNVARRVSRLARLVNGMS